VALTDKLAVVLLSGGIDSSTTLYIAQSMGFKVRALSVSYGQKQEVELEYALKLSMKAGVERIRLRFDIRPISKSALTSAHINVPKDRPIEEIGKGIPVSYVPARNTILLSLALSYAEILGSFDIFIGVNNIDYSGYPDCRPEYIKAFENMANLATKASASVEGKGKFTIHTPLINMSKADIIKKGIELKVPYEDTISCYDPTQRGISCGRCDSCVIRRNGFLDANVWDPTIYSSFQNIK